VRDTFIWSHLAGDSVQKMKIGRRVINQQVPWDVLSGGGAAH